MKGIIFPTEMHETGVSDNTLFLTSEDQQKEPTLTTAKTLKDYMQGIIALGNPGFATGDDVYEVISQLQNSRSNYHYLGVSNEEVAQLVNRMTPIQKEAFNTEIFVVQRTNGTVVQYALLKGEGPFGAGKQQITMADLVDLSAGQSLTLDEAMSDSSNNSVKNRVIKAYVDRVKENALVIDLIPPRCDVAAGSRNDLKILSDKIKNNERFNLFVRIMHDDSQVYELYPAICNGRGDGSYIEFFTYNGSNGSSLRYAEKLNANRYQISVNSGSMMASDYFSLTTANIIKPSIPADASWNDYVLSIGGLRKELKQLNSISAVFDIDREPGRQSVDLSAAEAQGFAAILENNPKIIFVKTDVYTYPTRFSGNRDENGGFSYTIDTISDLKQAQHSNYQYLEEEYIRLSIDKRVTTDENGQVTGTTYEASKQKMGSTAFMTSPYTIRHYQQNTDNLFSTDLRRYVILLKQNRNNSGQTSHGIVPLLIEHQTDPENAEKFQLCHGQVEAQDYNPNTNTGKIIIRWSLVVESGWQNCKTREYTAEAELSFDQVSSLMINHKNVELHEQNTDTHTNNNEFSIGKQAYNSAYTTLEQYPNGNKLVMKYHDIFPENQKMLADLYVNSLFFKKYEQDGTLSPIGKEAWISAIIPDEGRAVFSFQNWHDNEDGSATGIAADLETGNIRCEDVQMGNQLTLLNQKEEEEPYVYSSYAVNMQLVKNGEKNENGAYAAKLMIQDWNSANSYGAVDMGDLAVNGTATVNGQEVVTADTLKALAHKDQADWETDITNKPEFINKVKAGREVIKPGTDNSVYFRENDVIIPAKCEPDVKTKGTGNVVIYGYYDEIANSTEIRVKCTEHLLKQLISCASCLNAHYQVTNSEDVEEAGSAPIFFTAASTIGLKKDGYWSCKKIQNSKALRIENYDVVTALDAPDYNTPVNIWLNTDVLPEDVAPVYNQDKLEFLHSEEAGYKHIPAGGTVGQVLTNTAAGTAEWQDAAIIIPVDFTKTFDERKTAVLAFVQPFFDDGSIFTKPVYAQFTFTSLTDSVITYLIKGKNNVSNPYYCELIFDDAITFNKNGRPDPGYTLKLTKNNLDKSISYTENEVFNKTPEIVVEYAMQSKGAAEGYHCVFATGNCKKLDDAMYALHHGKPFALFYQPKGQGTQAIPGYLVKRAGQVDTTKVIYESGCQWDEVKKDGTIVHHDYKVVTDELTPTPSLVKSNAMGMCYKTENIISQDAHAYADKLIAVNGTVNSDSNHQFHLEANDTIFPMKKDPVITTKGTGNIAVYSYHNTETGNTELRVKCTEMLARDLILRKGSITANYTVTDSADTQTPGNKIISFGAGAPNAMKNQGYMVVETFTGSKSLTIDSYTTDNLSGPNYNEPINIVINTDTLPEDVNPIFAPDVLIFNHNNTTGFKHIPAGGEPGQILYNAEDGTGMWYDLPPVVERVFADIFEMDLPDNKLIFKSNDTIKPDIIRPVLKTKGTGNIAVYTHKNEETGEIELRLKAKEMLVVNLISKILYFSCTKVDNSDVTTTISKGCLISVQTQNAIIKNGYFKFESVSDAKSLTIDSVTQTAVAPNYNDPINFHLNTDVLPADVDPVFELEGMQFKHTDTTGFKHIPAGGTVGQVLTNTEDGTAEWQDVPESTALPTGVEGKFLKATGDESYEWADIPTPDLNGKVDKIEGKGLSTEDISIVITPTLASSYPDGTIVIKTI